MPEDDPFGDDGPAGPPLPPDDRLWRHPSEVAWTPPGEPPTPPDSGAGRSAASVAPRLWAVAVGAGVTGATLALAVVALTGGVEGWVTERVVERVPTSDPVSALADPGGAPGAGVPRIAADVSPSVVRIDVAAADGASAWSASGVVLRDDGTVVTAAHMLLDAGSVSVVLADGSSVPARIVGVDRLTDVAVVAAEGGDHRWHPAVLGSADDLAVGELAVAIGSSAGVNVGASVNVGVVSGLARRASAGDVVVHGLVETDALVDDVSSGGALCDGAGVVVGIMTVVDGTGFAVPADVARAVADALLDGDVRHAWLGVRGADAPGGGAHVAAVDPDSPAAAAGLQPGDVVVAVDGRDVASMSDLVLALRAHAPGDVVAVDVRRADARLRVELTLGERP